MKRYLLSAALVAASSPAIAEIPYKVKVFDHTTTIAQTIPVKETRCFEVKKPVYSMQKRDGNAGAGALTGMIIGGILGKGLTKDDGGAAAGAIVGGIIGADKGSKPTTQREIIGYEYVERCDEVVTYREDELEVYSHSTIRFYIDGVRYVLKFER